MIFDYLCNHKKNHDMKKIALYALAALSLAACDQQEKFTIEGTIQGAADSTLYLENVGLKGIEPLDSVRLDAEGKFSFSEANPEGPEFYILRIHNQIINISIDSTETVRVKGQYPNLSARYEVEGSDNCATIKELALMQQKLQQQVIALNTNRQIAPSIARDSLAALIDTYKKKVIDDYIFQGPNSTYAYFALFQTLGQWLIFDPSSNEQDLRAFAAVATSWDTFHPGSPRTKNLHDIVIKNMTDQRIVRAREQASQEGPAIVESGVIDLNLTDNKSQQRTLTELKGKVVLLDFHSFMIDNSPQRILMLRDLYNKYHQQGLEIYQVSLDGDEHFWLQKTLQLPWISVRDASGESARNYQVTAIPEYFLIDRNNQLQKRSSQMSDLEEEIKKLLSFRP